MAHALEAEYGPLDPAIQVLTHNSSQSAHIHRSVPLSFALLKQLLDMGRIAASWEDIYPLHHWGTDYASRRLLDSEERFRVRRAIYRLWLYTKAFHNATHPRETRLHRSVIHQRAALLHNWSNAELAELEDVRAILRAVLKANVCPSNGQVRQHLLARDPNADLSIYPWLASSKENLIRFSSQYHNISHPPKNTINPAAEGWGEEIPHYYVVEDMLKLDPGQILWLKDNVNLGMGKRHVEAWIMQTGNWFENNGETFGQTLEFVLAERGMDAEDFMVWRAEIENSEQGILARAGRKEEERVSVVHFARTRYAL
jgi:hypothetical protein